MKIKTFVLVTVEFDPNEVGPTHRSIHSTIADTLANDMGDDGFVFRTKLLDSVEVVDDGR